MENRLNHNIALLAVFLALAISSMVVMIQEPTITGFVVYEEAKGIKNWTFDNASEYEYNNSLINTGGSEAKLVSTLGYTYWNTSNETDYYLIKAWYNPSNKTDKVGSIDNNKLEVKEDNLFEIFFSKSLDNGDIISIYIKDGDSTNISLCKLGTACSSPDYGFIGYNESEGWFNITLSSLASPTKMIAISVKDDVEFDYITSSKGNITKALYDPDDKIDEVKSKDNEHLEADKDNLFNLIFNSTLSNNSIVSMYIRAGSQADVYLCDYGEDCPSPGYGLVNFNGSEGRYNITAAGLSEPKSSFNINPDKDMKFDYIQAVNVNITEHNATNLSYSKSAYIETKDATLAGLASLSTFHANSLLNNQSINYSYSVDSGNSWHIIPQDNNLSNISINDTKLRIKADFISNGTQTPIVYDFAVSYLTKICNENWNTTYGACIANDTRLKYYLDKNECGTKNSLAADNGTYGSCDYCSPSWACISYGECLLGNKKVCNNVIDTNYCFNATALDSDKYSGDYTVFNQSCSYSKIGDNYQNHSVSLTAGQKTVVNATNSTGAILEIVMNKDADNKLISITRHDKNLKNTSAGAAALGKYIDIIADEGISANLSSVQIKIYYTDEEVSNANLDEDTLKIHYFNDTSSKWQVLNSTVNSSGNYVVVSIGHLSTFGIFGQETTGSGSPGSSSGGGGGSTTIKKKAEEMPASHPKAPEEAIKPAAKEKNQENEPEAKSCDYSISVQLPEHVSFVESDTIQGILSNTGNCRIESLSVGMDKSLSEVISIGEDKIEGIGINESIEFMLVKKFESNSTSNFPIQGFSIHLPRRGIDTYDGFLTFGVLVEDQVALEEKVNIKVDVVKTSLSIGLDKIIPAMSAIIAVFAVALFIFFRKKKVEYP